VLTFFKQKKFSTLLDHLGERGLTLNQLLITLVILVIIFGVTISVYRELILRAQKITMQHDLQKFVRAEDAYLIDNGYYLGNKGDFIQDGNPPSGTLVVSQLSFVPSEDIRIEITSGSGNNHNGPPPFKAMVKHNHSKVSYEYNFAIRQRTEKDN
jgi:Tfp pilus assembly protein PilE